MSLPHMLRICVVEDEPKLLQNLVKKIGAVGPEFVVSSTARNGIDALDCVRNEKPDVLVTDIVMPMMDGLALIEHVKREHPNMPTIIVSGHEEFEYAKQALHFGVEEYLLKPVSAELVRVTLQRIRGRLESQKHGEVGAQLFQLVHGESSDISEELTAIELYAVGVCVGSRVFSVSREVMSNQARTALESGWTEVAGSIQDKPLWMFPRWWSVDGDAPNWRLLFFEVDARGAGPNVESLHVLHRIMETVFEPSRVTLCFSLRAFGVTLIKPITHRIRRVLQEHSRSAGTRVFDIDATVPGIINNAVTLSPEQLVSLMEEHLKENLGLQIDLESLCEEFGYSASYLSRVFSRFRGVPPIRYLNDLRIEQAQLLLLEQPEIDVGEVASITGFRDRHYFSRLFRKKTGLSPSEYRECGQTGASP